MQIINIHEAKTHLSKLVRQGQSFIIAKSGTPVAQILLYQQKVPQRIGFMPLNIPDNFARLAEDEILAIFNGNE